MRVLPEPMLKGIIALRDSLDICGFEETDDTKFLASNNHLSIKVQKFLKLIRNLFTVGSVIDSDHPNVKGYVRVWTYPSGIFCRTTE